MVCHEFKGGIGTASRVVPASLGGHTVGVLVQANYGKRAWLRVDGVPVGAEVDVDEVPSPFDQATAMPTATGRVGVDHRRHRHRRAAPAPPVRAARPARGPRHRPGRRDRRPDERRPVPRLLDRQPAADRGRGPAGDARVRRPRRRRRRHRCPVRRRDRGDRGSDRQRSRRGPDDDRARRRSPPTPSRTIDSSRRWPATAERPGRPAADSPRARLTVVVVSCSSPASRVASRRTASRDRLSGRRILSNAPHTSTRQGWLAERTTVTLVTAGESHESAVMCSMRLTICQESSDQRPRGGAFDRNRASPRPFLAGPTAPIDEDPDA